MMSEQGRGVVYLLVGERHAVHLAASLASLREHYAGPVAIITDRYAGYHWGLHVFGHAETGPLQVLPANLDASQGKLLKTLMPGLTPFDSTIYLDADTLVVGSIDELWPREGEWVLTQFSDWLLSRNRMRRRVAEWRDIEPRRVSFLLDDDDPASWPVLNTAVMAWQGDGGWLAREWLATAMKRPQDSRGTATDEMAIQLVLPEIKDRKCRVLDRRFNASCVFDCEGSRAGEPEDVRIIHYHGFKGFKRLSGQKTFLPFYESLLAQDRYGIRAMPIPAKMVSRLPSEAVERFRAYWTWC